MPRKHDETSVLKNFTFRKIILLDIMTVVWSTVAEYYDAVTVHEIGLDVIFLRERRLCLIRQTQLMVMKIL